MIHKDMALRRVLATGEMKIGQIAEIPSEEMDHLVKVMRTEPGEEIHIFNGDGLVGRGLLERDGKRLFVRLQQVEQQTHALTPIQLVLGVIKGDAMEWVIEKATELGAQRVQPVLSDHCVVQTQKKGADFFQTRWQKIADQALKQCGRTVRMPVALPISFEEWIFQIKTAPRPVLWCDEMDRATNASYPLIRAASAVGNPPTLDLWIGPEGGLSAPERLILSDLTRTLPGEIKRVHLGPLVLRAETAAVIAMGTLQSMQLGA